jgi:hypothetical protein
MALYENNLFLVRRRGAGPLLPELAAAGALALSGGERATVLGTLPCLYEEFPDRAGPEAGLTVLRLGFFERTFEPFMRREGRRLLEWLWTVFERHRLDYAFMGGGDAYEGYPAGEPVTDRRVTAQLAELVGRGIVRFPHPLMLFAGDLAAGGLAARAEAAPHYRVEHRAGVGWLLVLTNDALTADSIEILEPGMVYGSLVRHFQAGNPAPADGPSPVDHTIS